MQERFVVLCSPMMAIKVAETCSCSYYYNLCCVDELFIGFVEMGFITSLSVKCLVITKWG